MLTGNLGMTQKSRRRQKLVLVREPNGRSSRSVDEKEYAPVRVRRLLDASMAGMADAEWGTALGRLYVRGKLTAPLYAAGKRWSERVAKYHMAIDAPQPNPKALVLEGRMGGTPPDPDSDEGKKRVERDHQSVTDFLTAHGVLIGAGMLAEAMVRNVCERDHQPEGHEQLMALNRGLLWLANHWDLTRTVKS
jgi:hypothetical protein